MRPSRLTPYVLLLAWAYVATVVFLSLAPMPPGKPLFHNADKAAHFFAYVLMMVLFAWVYVSRPWRLGHALFCVGLGVAIEFAQRAGGLREFEWLDMLANALGVLAGLAAIHGFEQHRRRGQSGRSDLDHF